MKKSILTLIVTFVWLMAANAQKIALHSATGVQFFTGNNALVNSYNAAQPGDTIYLPGGTYPGLTFDKKLMIFGAGFYPDSTQVTGKTLINSSVYLSGNADGFCLEGVEINGGLCFSENHSVNQVCITRCKFQYISASGNRTTPSDGLAIIGCIISGGSNSLNNLQNVLFTNCIIENRTSFSLGNVFRNNIFLSNNSSAPIDNNCDNNILKNNIINTYIGSAGSTNTFERNIFVSATPGLGSSPIDINNYKGVTWNTIFLSQPGATFNYNLNYHLSAAMASYVGEDGTQVGIYGGAYPFKEGAVPRNPHFKSKSIAPQTAADGTLPVNITVTAQP